MAGAVREALTRLRERVAVLTAGEGSDTLHTDLAAVIGLLDREHRLRSALSDPGSAPETRQGIARSVLAGHIGRAALSVVEEVVASRWSRARQMLDELESVAARAAFARAEQDGRMDDVEERLFRFSRIVEGSPDLRRALDDRAVPAESKRQLARDLLGDAGDDVTLALVDLAVTSPRGRHVDEVLEEFVALAAESRQEVLADVTVATPLTPEQEERMAAALGRVYGRTVRLHVEVDPQVLGGARVAVGDEVIDGTVLHRLEEARRRLAG